MSAKKNTSFVQYSLCVVCQIHHNLGRKHLYLPQHKRNLKTILKKSILKVLEAQKCLEQAEVHDEQWEKSKTFWCYFCSAEFPRHQHGNQLMIKGLGMNNHFASHEHYEAVKQYLRTNRTKDKVEKYIIKKTDLLKFLELIPAAEAAYVEEMQKIHMKHISKLVQVEQNRNQLLQQCTYEMAQSQACSSSSHFNLHNNCETVVFHNAEQKRARKEVKIPPWLLPADASTCIVTTGEEKKISSDTVIGPTIADLQKHIEKQEKKKLNPKRVGANFNHTAATSSSWLPSFSKVWSKKRKKNSEFVFRKKKREV